MDQGIDSVQQQSVRAEFLARTHLIKNFNLLDKEYLT